MVSWSQRVFGGRDVAVNRLPPDQRIFLFPGDFLVTNSPRILSTLLGSCVAACLYDPAAGVAGMNHFLLPAQKVPESLPLGATASGRYGIEAMELLINAMLRVGAQKGRLRAKVFGGASLLSGSARGRSFPVGEANSRFVREFLRLESIAVEAEDLGGFRGRVIHFHTDTFFVWNRAIRNSQLFTEVLEDEAQAQRKIDARVGTEGDATLF